MSPITEEARERDETARPFFYGWNKKHYFNNSRASLKSLNWNLRRVNHIIIGHCSEEEPTTAATTAVWCGYILCTYSIGIISLYIGVVEYTRTSSRVCGNMFYYNGFILSRLIKKCLTVIFKWTFRNNGPAVNIYYSLYTRIMLYYICIIIINIMYPLTMR